MSTTFVAHILGWSFAPMNLLDEAASAVSTDSVSPEGLNLDFVPAALRRRCSNFSKVTLAVAHAAMRRSPSVANPHTVFASSHGESQITKDLLGELASHQPLSPMGFSLSVHNAASGLHSIATGNTAPSTAIAAGEDLLMVGLSEALLALSVGGAESVLCVCSDDRVPDLFLREAQERGIPYAFSIALGRAPLPHSTAMTVERSAGQGSRGNGSALSAIQFARWLREGGAPCGAISGGARWTFELSGGSAPDLFMTPYK